MVAGKRLDFGEVKRWEEGKRKRLILLVVIFSVLVVFGLCSVGLSFVLWIILYTVLCFIFITGV